MITEFASWQDIAPIVKQKMPTLEAEARFAFVYADKDPVKSLIYSRKCIEIISDQMIFDHKIVSTSQNAGDKINLLYSYGLIPARIRIRIDSVRKFGNIAAHSGSDVDVYDSDRVASDLLYVIGWLIRDNQPINSIQNDLDPAIQAGLWLLKKNIENVTNEQKIILDVLKKKRRAAISGSAGCGKTILAVEKAAQLDRVGLRVLVLCHNPYLADYISDLLIYTDVAVSTFVDFVNKMLRSHEGDQKWTHYQTVSAGDINLAFDLLVERTDLRFEAVIIDEAQDFAEEWWMVVEAATLDNGYLYIFYDNNQALLPLRGQYPEVSLTHPLSLNVRNSAEIAIAVGKFNRTPVIVRPELRGGTMQTRYFEKGNELDVLSDAFTAIFRAGLIEKCFIVATDVDNPGYSSLADLEVPLKPTWSWQDAVNLVMPKVLRLARTRAPAHPYQSSSSQSHQKIDVLQLSNNPYPTEDDVQALSKWAREAVGSFVHHNVTNAIWINVFRDYVEFAGAVSPMNVARFLIDGEWIKQLPKPPTLRLVPIGNMKKGLVIPLHSSATVKGLEADGIVTYIPNIVSDLRAHTYVALSRARLHQEVLISKDASRQLPKLE
jgi:hypothetical protein